MHRFWSLWEIEGALSYHSLRVHFSWRVIAGISRSVLYMEKDKLPPAIFLNEFDFLLLISAVSTKNPMEHMFEPLNIMKERIRSHRVYSRTGICSYHRGKEQLVFQYETISQFWKKKPHTHIHKTVEVVDRTQT